MEEFIKTLTEQMRCAKARDGVARELTDHITDQTQAYERSGMEHDKAVEKAVQQMGDPVEIGVSMDRIHRPQTDWRMLLLTLALSIAGLLSMMPSFGVEYVMSKQGLIVLGGFAVTAAVYFVDYSIIGRIGAAVYIALTILFYILQRCLPTINGRQPALFILVYLYVPAFAGILYRLRLRGYKAVMAGIAVSGITFITVSYYSKSLTAAVNIFLVMIVMLIAAIGKGMFGGKKKSMAAMTAAAVAIPAVLLFLYVNIGGAFFRWRRVEAFFHRYKYRYEEGYIYGVIRDILENARFVGAGSTGYFEEKGFTSVMSGELVPLGIIYFYGVAAALLMLILLAAMILHSAKIVHRQKNQLGFLVSMACTLVISVNCLEGILVSVGLFPVTTTAIPFLTRGGSTTLVYSVLIGLLLGVYRYEKVYTEKTLTHQPRWQVKLKIERN